MLTLTQMHQVLYGTLATTTGDTPISNARMRGYDITFTAGERTYTGRLGGATMQGSVSGPAGTQTWKATKITRYDDQIDPNITRSPDRSPHHQIKRSPDSPF